MEDSASQKSKLKFLLTCVYNLPCVALFSVFAGLPMSVEKGQTLTPNKEALRKQIINILGLGDK